MIVVRTQTFSQLALSILVVCLNGPFLIALIKNASLHTPSNAALGCLCFSDLMIGTVSILLWTSLISSWFGDDSEDIYKLFILMFQLYFSFIGLSALFIIAVNLDRYASICHPYKYLQYATPKLYVIISLCAVSLYAVIVCGLLLIYNIYNTYSLLLLVAIIICIAIFIIVFCNLMIIRVISKHRREISSVGHVTGEHRTRFDCDRKRHRVIILLVVVFLICNIPAIFSAFANYFRVQWLSEGHWLITVLSVFLVELNSIINPLVYLLRVGIFRNAVKELFCYQRSA